MAEKRGWPDWVKGICLYGMAPNGDLILIRTDEQGNLTVNLIPHHTTHEAGGSDEIDVTDLKGVLANLQKAKWSVYDTRTNFPAGEEVGALAYATDEKTLYRWDGTSWVKVLSLDLMQLMNRLHAATHESGGDDPIDFLKLTNRKHASKHESGGDDEINVTGLHGELADPQPPKTHASTHQPGGSDALPTGTPSAITEGATGSEGTSTKFARADHVHESPSEWTPKEHGNEAHSPTFLPTDGSAGMSGDLYGISTAPYCVLGSFFINQDHEVGAAVIIPLLMSDISFLPQRGGSITYSPTPDYGADYITDGKLTYATWSNPSGTIVVELTLHKTFKWGNTVYCASPRPFCAKDVTIEYYDPVEATWKTFGSVTDYASGFLAFHKSLGSNGASKLRFSFSNFNNSTEFRLYEVGLVNYRGELFSSYLLSRLGDTLYGDIDMNGNDILSPGLVDGVDVSSHAARHHSGGADPIYWNQLAINGSPDLNGHKILNPEGASGGMVAGVKWVDAVVYDGNPPSSWMLLDLSGYVGDRRALCVFRIDRPNATNNRLYQIAPADAYDLATDSGYALGPNSCWVKAGGYGYIISLTDSQGRVRIRSESAESTDKVRLLCYFTVT